MPSSDHDVYIICTVDVRQTSYTVHLRLAKEDSLYWICVALRSYIEPIIVPYIDVCLEM